MMRSYLSSPLRRLHPQGLTKRMHNIRLLSQPSSYFHPRTSPYSSIRCYSSNNSSASSKGSQSDPTTTSPINNPKVDFNDTQTAFKTKSLKELMLGYMIYQICLIPGVVSSSDKLLRLALKVLGNRIVMALLKPTFFAHFCAGEFEEDLAPRVARLREQGIGGIMDYAAEAPLDFESSDDNNTNNPDQPTQQGSENAHDYSTSSSTSTSSAIATEEMPIGRMYDYQGEKECDANMEIFLSCVNSVRVSFSLSLSLSLITHLRCHTLKPVLTYTVLSSMRVCMYVVKVHNVSPEGFAAIKITALGNPLLLQRMNQHLAWAHDLFDKYSEEVHESGGAPDTAVAGEEDDEGQLLVKQISRQRFHEVILFIKYSYCIYIYIYLYVYISVLWFIMVMWNIIITLISNSKNTSHVYL